jgi:hypothetical protein
LSQLDERPKGIVRELSAALDALGGGALPVPFFADLRRGRPPGGRTGRRKTGRTRTISAAARKKISEAQKRRWAEVKGKKREI